MDQRAFDEQLRRMYLATGTRTKAELAGWLGVRQTFVADAERRGAIPADWLLMLVRVLNVDPDWVLTGRGGRLREGPNLTGVRDDADAARQRENVLEMVRSLPSRVLAEELLRRAAIADADGLSRQSGASG